MSKPDGGPAFPITGVLTAPVYNGMTLRDYFASAALQGYRSAYHQWFQKMGATGEFADPQTMAKWAYKDADAMLAERLK